jgi:hypothetical protein
LASRSSWPETTRSMEPGKPGCTYESPDAHVKARMHMRKPGCTFESPDAMQCAHRRQCVRARRQVHWSLAFRQEDLRLACVRMVSYMSLVMPAATIGLVYDACMSHTHVCDDKLAAGVNRSPSRSRANALAMHRKETMMWRSPSTQPSLSSLARSSCNAHVGIEACSAASRAGKVE